MAKVQTLTEIRAMLDAAGIKPQHRFGQNFFVDGNLLRRLVDAADIHPSDTVVEIGGGTGVLTDLLAERCSRLLVVEIDRTLAPMLADRFAPLPHVTIHQGDALHGKHRLCDFLLTELSRTPAAMLVANLPYHIATPLLIDLLIAIPGMKRLVFTVQKEVADRIAARPNTKPYGPVSIVLQAVCTVQNVAQVPPPSFWPRPRVDSQMLRLDRKPESPIPSDRMGLFSHFVKMGFLHRRKLLAYNLTSAGYQVSDPWATNKARPEDLSVDMWIRLFNIQPTLSAESTDRRHHHDERPLP